MCPGSDYHWINGGSTNSSRIVGAYSGDDRLAGMFSDESRELWTLIGSCTRTCTAIPKHFVKKMMKDSTNMSTTPRIACKSSIRGYSVKTMIIQ